MWMEQVEVEVEVEVEAQLPVLEWIASVVPTLLVQVWLWLSV